ncbi:redox-sensing transcriptional repressor Rex [Spirochaeta cellobiosiphila]|uniref:redox-sensing transcriptional repressor Rex n=1 Tax=Spirochaeta cellobiosiphila TaxID=504483 RepID=UPI00056504D1|nr:redox-sensing transcriptional repressor Rex [Spirochaeta cellobiosiphila]
MSQNIPKPAIKRLASLYPMLSKLLEEGQKSLSSQELGTLVGAPAHTIRKDFSYLKDKPISTGTYNLSELRDVIGAALGLTSKSKTCIVGLGELGQAIMNYPVLLGDNYNLVAGFDTNINRLEILKTPLPLFPAYELPEVVAQKQILLGILAVDTAYVDKSLQRMIEGGIKGILNLSPIILPEQIESVQIRNIFLSGELNLLEGLIKNST